MGASCRHSAANGLWIRRIQAHVVGSSAAANGASLGMGFLAWNTWIACQHFRRNLLALIQRRYPVPDHSFFLFGPRGTGKTTWLRQVLPEAL